MYLIYFLHYCWDNLPDERRMILNEIMHKCMGWVSTQTFPDYKRKPELKVSCALCEEMSVFVLNLCDHVF